jgi:hypothetical protein
LNTQFFKALAGLKLENACVFSTLAQVCAMALRLTQIALLLQRYTVTARQRFGAPRSSCNLALR